MTTGSPARLPAGRELSVDVASAAALATFLVVTSPLVAGARPGTPAVPAAGLALLACCGVGLAARRVSPVAAYGVVVGAADAYLWLGYPGWPVYLGAFAGLAVLVAGVVRVRTWVPDALLGGAGLVVGATAHQDAQPASVLVLSAVRPRAPGRVRAAGHRAGPGRGGAPVGGGCLVASTPLTLAVFVVPGRPVVVGVVALALVVVGSVPAARAILRGDMPAAGAR